MCTRSEGSTAVEFQRIGACTARIVTTNYVRTRSSDGSPPGARRIGGVAGLVNTARTGQAATAQTPQTPKKQRALYRPLTPVGRFIRDRLVARARRRNVQVIGLCRFSYPALGGYKIEHEDPAARAAYLYDPARLNARFRMFETLTLPSLRAQTDPDFTFVIVIGQDFPQRERLQAMVAGMPQVVIQARPPGRHRDVMKEAMNSVRRPGAWCLQFRHDDDDAVNRDFVRKLRRIFAQHYPLFAGSRHVAVDFTRGHNIRLTPEGMMVEPANQLFLGVGFAIGFRPDVSLSVMNFTHHTVWQHMPTITRTDPDMWLRGVNDHNDSGDAIGLSLARPDAKLLARLESGVGISDQAIRDAWSRIEPR